MKDQGRGPGWFILGALGWLSFGIGCLGIVVPGLPTTIFWIMAAGIFVRTNTKAHAFIVNHKRFGPGIKLFLEKGAISKRGKFVSISAMMGGACLGAFLVPPLWVKVLILLAATGGSVWVGVLPIAPGPTQAKEPQE